LYCAFTDNNALNSLLHNLEILSTYSLLNAAQRETLITSGESAKLEVGERYIQVWASDNDRVPFPSIITIWRWGTL